MMLLRPAVALLLLSSTLFGAEIAELRNGFSIRHRTRETRDGLVRLYIDDQKKSFVDVPAAEIECYSNEPDRIAPAADSGPAKSTSQIVREASEKHGVDSDFIRSVIRQESAGNAHAVSPAGARGLMQLMPGTASQLGVDDSFSPEQNVHGGTRYLRELLERYDGDAIKALAAYNAGPKAVDRYKGVPPYRETRQYVQRVILDYNKSKRDGAKTKQSSRNLQGQSADKTKIASSRTAATAERSAP
jgi:soluble lytic murein transglycosylase-like protein